MKSYYTEFLSNPSYKDASTAQKYCRETRMNLLKDPITWSLHLSSPVERETNLVESKILLLAPLLYKFPNEFGVVNPVLRKQCRDALYAVLTTTYAESVMNPIASEQVVVFIEAMRRHLHEDKREIALPLFTNYHDVLVALDMYPDDPDLQRIKVNLEQYIQSMKLENDVREFLQGMQREKESIVRQTFQKAYWDRIAEDLENKDFTLFLLCLDEIRDLLHHRRPHLTPEQLQEVLDPNFIQQQLELDPQLFDRTRIQHYFDQIHHAFHLPPLPSPLPSAEVVISKYVCLRLQHLYDTLRC